MYKILLVTLCVFLIVQAEVIPFDNSAIEKIFQEKKAALFLFTNNNQASTNAKAALQAYDEAGSNVILTISDEEDGNGLYERLGEYLGVDVKNPPQVLYMGEKTDKYNFNAEEITKDTLASFVEKVQSGQLQQFFKSSPIPETNDEPVKIGVGKTFKELVLDSDKQVLVEFYAPWCGHCKNLAPQYDEAAKRLLVNPNVMLMKVDSTENEVPGVDIQGFPTLKFWGKDKTVDPIDYNGERTADGIVSWIKEHTQYEWVEPEVPAEEPTASEL